MIPADLAARLRLLNEASFFNTEPPVAGLQRAREIQAQLPELVPGQRFFATLQRTLPDGTFRALVAGQQMTLSLNSAAKSGDTLELEVSQVTPRAVFARIVGAETAAGNTASAQPALSQTGRLISFLLTGPMGSSMARSHSSRMVMTVAPNRLPDNEPRPPATTNISTLKVSRKLNILGSMVERCDPSSAPPTPAKNAPMQNESTL